MSISEEGSDSKCDKSIVKLKRLPELGTKDGVSITPEIPEEAWLTIFEKLDVKDQLTCLRTCPDWKKWLSHKWTILLIPQLAPLILDRLQSTSDVLNLRTVCKSWKEAVDRFNVPYGTMVRCNEFLLEAGDYSNLGLQVIFSCNEEVQAFMEDMKSHIGNPFPGRTVGFCPVYGTANTVEDDERNTISSKRYWNNVNELLEKFGSHLSVACIIMSDIDFYSHGKNDFEGLIREIVTRLQNVKHLQMVIDVETDQVHFFQDQGLPRLFRLEALDLYVCNPELLAVLLGSFCVPANIKRLRVIHDDAARLPDVVYQLRNLKHLRADINCNSDLERFQCLQQPPPLQDITFIFDSNRPVIELIFTCLERFKSTLVHAYIMFLEIPTPEYTARQKKTICNGLKLNLPNLRKITLHGYNGPLDPFLQLNSLEYFEVLASGDLWEWEGSEVDFVGFENQMYNSNIWDLIPSLKGFGYSASKDEYGSPVNPLFYNRKGLEQYRLNNVDDN